MAGKTEKLNLNEQLNDFIQKNRKVLIISLAGIIGAVIVLVTVFTVRDHLNSQALSQIEEFKRRYETISSLADALSETPFWTQEASNLLEDLDNFTNRNSGYTAARSYAISANIHQDQNNWIEAERAWVNAARAGTRTYFAPVAFFNAAVAAEEQGNFSRAIELYNEALEYEGIFPAAPRTQFSIARLQEIQGDSSAALISYMTLVSRWPQDQVWVNLANSRILSLSIGQ